MRMFRHKAEKREAAEAPKAEAQADESALLAELSYQEAFKAAEEDPSLIVCGVMMPNETVAYFTIGADASEDEVADMAFTIRYGHEPSPADRTFQRLVKYAQNR